MTLDLSTRVDTNAWHLIATEPGTGGLYLANGYLGSTLSWDAGLLGAEAPSPCYLRGLYANHGPEGIDRLAGIPCWGELRYAAPVKLMAYRRTLDLRRGVVETVFELEEARGRVQITQTILISRTDQHQTMMRLEIAPEFDGEIEVVSGLDARPGGDLQEVHGGWDARSLWLQGTTVGYGIVVATALFVLEPRWTGEVSGGEESAVCRWRTQAQVGETVVLTQMARVATGMESSDPLTVARAVPREAVRVRRAHERAWAELWKTAIEIEGDAEVERFARAALFYLWSSIREDDRWSIAPMGLSSTVYNGHIFWDTELWMYPALLLTQPGMAKSCVAYREQTIGAARERARTNGQRGAQFPWEAAFTGAEMTPRWAETRDFQLHITADVAIAQWWYYLNTGDVGWLREHGEPVIHACAEYWASRVEWHAEQQRYEISDVVCADEYAEHVNNDAFTNAAVLCALRIALRTAAILGKDAPPEWAEIIDTIYIPYDEEHGRHLEYDGYDGRVTKQADVELLAYPLEYVTDPGQVARDLDFYAQVIDPDGPAMSFSVYSIVSAQLGRMDDAYKYLRRSYGPNTRAPFLMFSETPSNHAYFFCTGLGGALQALLFGFTGLRLREGFVVLDPMLPVQWERLCLRQVSVLGARVDIDIVQGQIRVTRGEAVVTVRREDGGPAVVEQEGGATGLVEDDGWADVLLPGDGGEVRLRIRVR